MNLTCAICGELFNSTSNVQITPCGHMYHTECILQWFERSKTCPQCRSEFQQKSIHKVFFTSQIDDYSLQRELNKKTLKINKIEKELRNSRKEIENLKINETDLEKIIQEYQFLIQSSKQEFNIFKSNYSNIVKEHNKEIIELNHKIEIMSTTIDTTILTLTETDVEKCIKECNNKETLTTWIVTLKRELHECESERTDLKKTLRTVQYKAHQDNVAKSILLQKVYDLESEIYQLKESFAFTHIHSTRS